MAKRRIRITPKIRRKIKKVKTSPESLNESQKETSSTEEDKATKRKGKAQNGQRRAASKRKVTSERDVSSSRYSSTSSLDNESHEESIKIKKKRHVDEEDREPVAKSSKIVKSNTQAEKNVNQEAKESGRARGTSSTTTKSSRKESERIRDLIVTKKVFSKWKPISSSTKDYVKHVIADVSPKVIGNITSERSKDEVQYCLKILEKKILVKMGKIKGPRNQQNYRELEPESKRVEESLTSTRSQLSLIEVEVEEQKRLLESEEEKLAKLTLQPIKKPHNTKQLHPSLQKMYTPTLDLPKPSQEALDLPIPKIPSEFSKGAQRLNTTLAGLSNQVDNIGITNWLESLTQLQTSLN